MFLFRVFTYHAETGIWPYPMLNLMYGTIFFPIFFITLAILYILCYYVQWPLTALVFDSCNKSKKIRYCNCFISFKNILRS